MGLPASKDFSAPRRKPSESGNLKGNKSDRKRRVEIRMTRRRRRTILTVLTACLALAAFPLARPVAAAEAKVLLASFAWYWEDQQSQTVRDPSGTDAATVEVPNPFCPGPGNGLGAPDQTCRSGRLPIEVRGGDYETPNKISAVAFDLAVVPIGSKVQSFKVTFLEANDEQSRPVNAQDRELQACLLEEFFGEGEARPYKAVPRHTCSKTDPMATRKPVKGKDGRFQYTFDLTAFAKAWAADPPPATGIVLYPVKPKEAGPDDDSWRVVLDGPLENEGKSIKADISFTPPPDAAIDPIDPGTSGDLGSVDSGGGLTTSTSSGGDFGSTDTAGLGGDTAADTAVAEGETAPVAVGEDEEAAAASEVLPTTNSTPWYVWLSLLAGIVGFSMVRSVVLESHAGIRPDGVLAQIRRINADRRGAPVAADRASPFAPIVGALAGVGRGARSILTRLPMIRRKG